MSAISNAPDVNGVAFPGCGGELVEPTDFGMEQQVAELVNQERAAVGLPPMKLVAGLSNAARYHAADMTHDDYFDHDSYDRINATLVKSCDWFQRIQAYYPSPRAENIAWGYRTPASVMNGWMNSSGHRANILGDYREIGVGLYEWRWVQDFGSRRDVYPLIINGEAASTDDPQVTLYLYGEWDEVRLRNDGGQWSEWSAFESQMTWRINATAGKHLVEAEVRNADATVSSSDSIDYVGIDKPTPEASPSSAPTATEEPTSLPTVAPTAIATATPIFTPGFTPTVTETPTAEPSATAVPSTATATPMPQLSPTPVVHEPHLRGRVLLQGRPPAPHANWITPLQLLLADVVTGDVHYALNTTTTENGEFSTQPLAPGSYLAAVKGQHTLQRVTKVVIDETNSQIEIGLLHEGDIDENNLINLRDFSLFRRSYGSCGPEPVADLNNSGCVDLQDLQLFIGNFGMVGETLTGEPPYDQTATIRDLEPMPEPPPVKRKREGERFTLAIVAEGARDEPVDAAAFYLNFNPDQLQVLDVIKGGAFDVLLDKEVDNQIGHVDFAVGNLGTPATAPTVLALLVVEATSDLADLPLTFTQEGMRSSDLYYDGESVITNNRSANHFALAWQEVSLDQHLFLPLVQIGN